MYHIHMAVELRRKAYQGLLQWKEEKHGETALLINGARRVGKSYLAESFGKNEYRSYMLVNFDGIDPGIIDIFENHSYDLDIFFEKLTVAHNVTLYPRESLVIFDEVQLYPKARQMIKRLVKDGRYDYIETGSLLSIKTNVENILIPSEEEDFFLHPLDFEEFLWAVGNKTLGPYMRKCFEELSPMGLAEHKIALDQFRRYMLIGGMPAVVAKFVETKSFEKAEEAKRVILRLYRKDIARYATDYRDSVNKIFDSMPGQLNKKEKKFILSSVEKDARSRQYDDAFMWLVDAMIANLCLNSTDPTVGLAMSEDHRTKKLYMVDTGLLVTMAMDVGITTEEDVYKGILLDKIGINEGMFAENVVAQALRANDRKLFFYSRYSKKTDEGEIVTQAVEVDFLVRRGRDICPIEVKSSKIVRHDSIIRFNSKFKDRLGRSYILCTKDIRTEGDIVLLPIYMAWLLRCCMECRMQPAGVGSGS